MAIISMHKNRFNLSTLFCRRSDMDKATTSRRSPSTCAFKNTNSSLVFICGLLVGWKVTYGEFNSNTRPGRLLFLAALLFVSSAAPAASIQIRPTLDLTEFKTVVIWSTPAEIVSVTKKFRPVVDHRSRSGTGGVD